MSVIAGIPAYFLAKVFVGYIPPVPGIVKQLVFLMWFATMTVLFFQQLTQVKVIHQKWSIARVPVLVIVVLLSANVARFIPYIIPDENVYAIFRAIAVNTGIIIPLSGLKVMLGIVGSCTLFVSIGALYQVYDGALTRVADLRQKAQSKVESGQVINS